MAEPKVTIIRCYDVQCETCNETVVDMAMPRTRQEAEKIRRVHIAIHAAGEAGYGLDDDDD